MCFDDTCNIYNDVHKWYSSDSASIVINNTIFLIHNTADLYSISQEATNYRDRPGLAGFLRLIHNTLGKPVLSPIMRLAYCIDAQPACWHYVAFLDGTCCKFKLESRIGGTINAHYANKEEAASIKKDNVDRLEKQKERDEVIVKAATSIPKAAKRAAEPTTETLDENPLKKHKPD
jgi:hypothetical protein